MERTEQHNQINSAKELIVNLTRRIQKTEQHKKDMSATHTAIIKGLKKKRDHVISALETNNYESLVYQYGDDWQRELFD